MRLPTDHSQGSGMVPELLAENAPEPPLFDGYPFSIELPMVAERLPGAA